MNDTTKGGAMSFDAWYETYERDGGELLLFNTIDLAAAFETGRKVEYERIAGLLAEVERLGGEVAALRSDLSGRFFVEQVEERARRQAAREAVEIVQRHYAENKRTSLIAEMMAHFGLEATP